MTKAVAYMRTSSAAGVGEGKDSEPRQRLAISAFAGENGFVIDDSDWYYDPKVRGADPVTSRPGFAAMLDRIAGNRVRTIIVESPDRFARDLIVQLTGHDHLQKLGITLIPATAPEYFTENTPTATLIRQVLGAVAEFEKASLVAKLHAARTRKRKATGKKVGGRKNYAEINPEMVATAKALEPGKSLRQIAAALAAVGYTSPNGGNYAPAAVKSMLLRVA